MLPTLLLLIGCITIEPPHNPLIIDDDGDGYTEFEGDCDDRDSETFPGSVTEARSNECMKDTDGDGFGDVNVSGYFDAGTDCDDLDPDTFPGSITEAISGECMKDTDGDGFGDGDVAGDFDAGTDCDDSNPFAFPGAAENESETECLTDEDEDGWSAEVGDCDDSDPSTVDDMDCDGVLTVDDCDDGDVTLLAQSEDMDCDGVLSVDDCDDSDASTVDDMDCDGVLSVDDCDDTDSTLLSQSDDMDCDGVLSVDDCDDTDSTLLLQSDDMDCDGVLSVDDCDDSDPLELNLCVDVGGQSFEATLIPSGTFTMGCTSEQGSDCWNEESPTHQVTLNTDFYIMKNEVTQGVYQQVMGNNPSSFSGSNRPVEMVSWYDAARFANALSAQQGLLECYNINGNIVTWSNTNCTGWRLPTEAEWEYAARGGESYKYAGSNNVDDVAWYSDNSDYIRNVCSKQENGYGLCDMSGNVSEWVWDWYDSDYYSSSPSVDPQGPFSGSNRVRRGGSWGDYAQRIRVSFRDYYYQANTIDVLGFRLARTSP